ncbi:carbohydrate kinase family protein [Nocardioides mangrovi]|uniref:PfkB family carbohydrate kinase n=1 Tax=Nocardioides mangrovi TaxID=2874580 RepID=A0ABS7UD57_9ACTN|nr:PfkB family carbohydrate kinase [Nocardioides mangrovi]MBZ5738722.1 PfkB family carbohydrate kinase [Nocardioides mangrovi]
MTRDRAHDVVVLGDANPDLVLRGDVVPRFGQAEQLVDAADLTLGGSGAIMAAGLARLGVDVAIVAAVGRDPFGDLVLGMLEEHGVATDLVVRRGDLGTGLSVVLSAGTRAILTHAGAIGSLTAADVPAEAVAAARHVHVASPYLVTRLRADLPTVLAGARSSSVDTNDDPARAWADLAALADAAGTLLPNDGEVVLWAQALGHRTDDWLDAAAYVASRGVEVVVKAGAEGGAHVTADGVVRQEPAPVTPVDTTGAGDTFDAAWVAARLAGEPPERALRWAVAAGTLSTQGVGGTAAQPDRDTLLRAVGVLP